MATSAIEVAEWALRAIALLLSVPVGVLAVQIASALRRSAEERDVGRPPGRLGTVAVLMPAHDEEHGIDASIRSVRAGLSPGDRLLVVADNCSDHTAEVARAAGAEVVERHDSGRRGKGFALDHGVRHLAAAPPATVVIIDADCSVAPGAIDLIARRSQDTGRPVQALYLMRSPPGAPLKTRIAEFAWAVKNEARALGAHRLGLPCQLMGSGMALPWSLVSAAPLASGHIVEDLQLGLDLAVAGSPPLFCATALVTSTFPLASDGLASQRTRWEHGHLGVMAHAGPRLLWHSLVQRRAVLLGLALDICVPPVAALVMALAMAVVASAAVALAGEAVVALVVAAVAMAVLALTLAAAWWRFGRGIVTLAELATVPAYIVAKLPMYARMLRRRQTDWIRTRRDDGHP